MTIPPKVRRFRPRPEADLNSQDPSQAQSSATADTQGDAPAAAPSQDPNVIATEGLTPRQLRTARRLAQRHGLTFTSDFDAVAQLRARGVDPFGGNSLLDIIPDDGQGQNAPSPITEGLPAKRATTEPARTVGNVRPTSAPGPMLDMAADRSQEILALQRDIARRRRRKLGLLIARLSFFVLLPTFIAGWYFYVIATPMYATESEFSIDQPVSAVNASVGSGSSLVSASVTGIIQDSVTVQSYLTSRTAMMRLDEDLGFRTHFSQDWIDPLQRLPNDAAYEDAYKIFERNVKVGFDPTEGILRMEVIAADPETSEAFAKALVGYAEEQIDRLTLRLREAQMADAEQSYQNAEQRRTDALNAWLAIQQDVQQVDPSSETMVKMNQIAALEAEKQQLQITLRSLEVAARPVESQLEQLRLRINTIEGLTGEIRASLTAPENTSSQASKNTELRIAEENYNFQVDLVRQALAQMEASRLEAARQVRYIKMGVEPVAPDKPTYPRAFENTIVALLVFAGIYLMLSITASVLREQVSS
ncbi:Capsule polysaccharide export protein-like protein [Ketogulonicigenium robustum]|uniref:Capsule polysaccharide export protein-like protein n=1 Tax=Ketogulonicigenium robustum TaxID=92947 RepID=A0A1W6NWH4_9RHOB|nr:capsule biosynthesis protein [Ketogulonicigenium robustum]ARO13483.1 Capsule polysaccharide export protein-like protein [Ketogulonicigenium robustum]